MTVRYERTLNKESEELLKATGKLNFLINGYETWIPSDPNAFDIQLREKNQIMIYHGGTRLITISLAKGSVKLSAAKSYSNVGDSYATLMKEWTYDDLVKKQKEYKEYLINVVVNKIVQDKFYKTEKEGWWSNRLSLYFGKNWNVQKEWLIIDREAVLGFKQGDKKAIFYEKMKEKYLGIRSKLRINAPNIWGKEDLKKSFGDELDFLAIGPEKELLCIELKHGSNTSGIYWGPLQVSVYKDAFYGAVSADSSISSNIKSLVKQKVALGLLPKDALNLLPEGNFKKVKAIVAITGFNNKSCSWQKMLEVQNELGVDKVSVAKIEESGSDLIIIP